MTKIFEPGWGNAALRTIFETEYPEQISLIPSTPGWWLLLFVLLGLIARAIWRRRQRYLRDRYRRDALAELAKIKERIQAGGIEAARELSPLLRATAIAAVGRETMSELQGESYALALAELAPDQERLPVEDLQYLAYAPLDKSETMDINALITPLECWIKQHRGSDA